MYGYVSIRRDVRQVCENIIPIIYVALMLAHTFLYILKSSYLLLKKNENNNNKQFF